MQNPKNWLWLGASFVSSFLFYRQSAGMNYLLFNTLLVGIALGLYPALRKSVSGRAVLLGCLLTASAVVWNHTWLALGLNWFSCLALAGFCVYPRTSLAVALPNGLYSGLLSFWKGEWFLGSENRDHRGLSLTRMLTWLFPVLVTGLFLVLYMIANPAFAALIEKTGGEIISLGRLFFTLVCAYGLLAFFYPTGIYSLIEVDQRVSNTLARRRANTTSRFFSPVALKQEYRTGWLLFTLLNGLLLLFNGIDLYYLVTGRLPEGVTYAAYVHQGVAALITSIVLAIGIVMYFFRRNLNFYRRSDRLRAAAYTWIGQNILVVLATAYKNGLYIDAYGLTHKRVGVYVYLALALAGLLTTYVKVRRIKSNAFLVRCNSWIFYAVLAGMTLFNWPRLISRYNLTHLPAEQVDFQYLSHLSNNNLDLLQTALKNPKYLITETTRGHITNKINRFRQLKAQQDWRAWNYADARVRHHLESDKP